MWKTLRQNYSGKLPRLLIKLTKSPRRIIHSWSNKNNTTSNKIRRLIELHDWNAIKNFSKYRYSLRKDLSVNPNGCILYDGKMYIPTQLRKTVIDSVHKTHQGQAGMIYLAQLIWYPEIHRDVVALAQRCKQCTKLKTYHSKKQARITTNTIRTKWRKPNGFCRPNKKQ